MTSVLIACADFHPDISKALVNSCTEVFDAGNVNYKVEYVSGCLELPALIANSDGYDGYVALGCVIRGETDHYYVVSREASRGLMNLSTQRNLLIVNGILFVENRDQAMKRVSRGSFCATALMRLLSTVRS